MHSSEKRSILYPADPQYNIVIDSEFAELWRKTHVPDDTDVEKALSRFNFKPMELYHGMLCVDVVVLMLY